MSQRGDDHVIPFCKEFYPSIAWRAQEFEEIYNLAMGLTVENDHATVVRVAYLKHSLFP